MRRWIFGVLATCGVTAAIAVPLLAGSEGKHHPARSSPPVTTVFDESILDESGHPLPLRCKWYTKYTEDCEIVAARP